MKDYLKNSYKAFYIFWKNYKIGASAIFLSAGISIWGNINEVFLGGYFSLEASIMVLQIAMYGLLLEVFFSDFENTEAYNEIQELIEDA